MYGSGSAYLVVAGHPAEVCEPGRPLTYRGYPAWKFPAGSTIDLAHRPTGGYRVIDVVEGKLSANPYE